MGPLGTYTFNNVNRDHTIEALFEILPPVRYEISAVSGAHGSIWPAGAVTDPRRSSDLFTISADSGYRIRDVRVDGQSMGPLGTYTFTNVDQDHTIEALFEVLPAPERKAPYLPFLRLLLVDE
jgi:hypothetical protein